MKGRKIEVEGGSINGMWGLALNGIKIDETCQTVKVLELVRRRSNCFFCLLSCIVLSSELSNALTSKSAQVIIETESTNHTRFRFYNNFILSVALIASFFF